MAGKDNHQNPIDREGRELAPGVRSAIVDLAKAYQYASEISANPWEFAIEIERLTATGITTSDLRWLVTKGYVEHAREITASGDTARRFEPAQSLSFPSETCFVVTDAGLLLAAESEGLRIIRRHGRRGEEAEEKVCPRWDPRTRTLRVGEELVKRYKVPSPNQEAILVAFEEEGWPTAIDDPLPPHAEQDRNRRLRNTIQSLNTSQVNQLLHFCGDGTGHRGVWELLTPAHVTRRILRKVA